METGMGKKIYQTEQRKQILQFLKENKKMQYTIEEIVANMNGEHRPGKSTIYRIIKQLVEEGQVKRSNKNNTRQFVYQLLDGEACHHHFHMQCESCGKLFHLKEEKTKQVQGLLQQQEQFLVDIRRCVFYGTCMSCK